MKLYNYFRSSAAYRTRIAFNLKGVQPETVEVDLRAPASDQQKPDYRSINPQALVPALTVEDTTIAQSLAIIEYLDETYPEPPLMPRSPVNRARVRAMALAIACDMHPLNNLRVLTICARRSATTKKPSMPGTDTGSLLDSVGWSRRRAAQPATDATCSASR